MSGPIALPASNNERSGLQSMRDWFNKKKGKDNAEETPLLGGSTSRKSTRKVITIAVASVVALGVLGTAGYFIHNCHDGHKGRILAYTLFFF
jgi:hypothetical protein